MNVKEYMCEHGLADTNLGKATTPFECRSFPHYDTPVYSGSHLDAAGAECVTIAYPAAATQKAAAIARQYGVKPSGIYHDALKKYPINT